MFSHLKPDVFLSTYNRRYNYHPHIQGKFGYQDDEILDSDRIYDLFSGIDLQGVLIDDNSENYKVPDNVDPRHRDHESTYYQYLKFRQAVQLMEAHEKLQGFRYDFVIKSRCDLVYSTTPIMVNPSSVTIDSANTYPNDWIFMSSRDNIVGMSEFIMDEFYSPKYDDSHETPPHRLLLNSMKHLGLDIVQEKLVDYVLRRDDKKQYY
jgi:hypothetical protein